MRVLHIISSGGMYGAEAVILQLSAEVHLTQSAVSMLGVFSHVGQPVPELHLAAIRAGVSSELLSCRGQLDLAVPHSIRALASRWNVDIIHAHGYKADIYTYAAFRSKSRPALVSTCHTWYDNDLSVRLYGAADRWVLRHFDEVVAVSTEVKQRLLASGVAEERTHLIRNGVSLSQPKDGLRHSDRTGAARVRVGLVGRLAPEKGVDVFLRAAALLASRYPEAEFVIAGDGPDRPALETLRRELGLENKVAFLGQQRDMGDFYSSLDLQVSASRQEGLPMALLEGMAAGLPIVATVVGEVPQVIADGRTGMLVEPNSPVALADAIAMLLAAGSLRSRFGLEGRKRVQEIFSASRMAADYLAVYRSALARRPMERPAANVLGGVL